MALGLILTILAIGLLLIFLEVFLIPGTTLFGVVGGIAMVVGVILMYSYYGKQYGHITLGISSLAVLAALVAGFKVIDSNKLAMKGEIKGKMNVLKTTLTVGSTGVTVTELRPNGKANFGSEKTEVFSDGPYIALGSEVEVIKITHDKIFVKPLNA